MNSIYRLFGKNPRTVLLSIFVKIVNFKYR